MTTIRFQLIALSIAIAASTVRAESEPDIPWGKLRDTASRYLDACSSAKETIAMTKRLKQRVQQRLQDSETLGEDSIMRSIMLDWAASNIGKLKRKERETIAQACFYFVTF